MNGKDRVLVAVDEPTLGEMIGQCAVTLGFEPVVAFREAEGLAAVTNAEYCMAVTVPKFDRLALVLTKALSPTPTVLLCADSELNGLHDGEHLRLLPLPCSTESLLQTMAGLCSIGAGRHPDAASYKQSQVSGTGSTASRHAPQSEPT